MYPFRPRVLPGTHGGSGNNCGHPNSRLKREAKNRTLPEQLSIYREGGGWLAGCGLLLAHLSSRDFPRHVGLGGSCGRGGGIQGRDHQGGCGWHTAPVWCLLGGSTRPTRGSLGGSAWMGHAEEEGGGPTEGPVKMGEGGGGERDAEEK